MQRGLATLEIVIAVMIIAVLAKVATLNAARVIDRAELDYEIKRLYSDLRLVQSMDRISEGDKPTLFINKDKNLYQIFREAALNNPIREPHELSYGVTIYYTPQNKISFAANGVANIAPDHITLKSRRGKTKEITFDTVGRMR